MKLFLFYLFVLFSSVLTIGLSATKSFEVAPPSLTTSEKVLLKRAMIDVKYRGYFEEKERLSLKAQLGKRLFYDQALSRDKNISCASCHVPNSNFHDVNNLSQQVSDSPIRAMSIRGVYTQDWYFWDGRADSLWAQVLDALTRDHGLTTKETARYVCNTYASQYPSVLTHCDQTEHSVRQAVEVGKLIAAYVSTIDHYWTRFDEYVYRTLVQKESNSDVLTNEELAGMRLFFDSNETGCINCHSGSRFTNGGFYSIGTGQAEEYDRLTGAKRFKNSPYQCKDWNNAEKCSHSLYPRLKGSDLKGAFKVPSLRNLKDSPAFMHDGRFKQLEEVIDFYVNPYDYPLAHTDVMPLRIMPHQRTQLILFLQALNDEYVPPSNFK